MEDASNKQIAISDKELQIQLVKVITKVSMIAGMKISPDMLAVMVEETFRILTTCYPEMKVPELAEVLRYGVIGDYGEDTYLCVRNINTWLKKWATEQRRLKEMSKKREDDENKMPLQAKVTFLIDNIDKMPFLKEYLEKHISRENVLVSRKNKYLK